MTGSQKDRQRQSPFETPQTRELSVKDEIFKMNYFELLAFINGNLPPLILTQIDSDIQFMEAVIKLRGLGKPLDEDEVMKNILVRTVVGVGVFLASFQLVIYGPEGLLGGILSLAATIGFVGSPLFVFSYLKKGYLTAKATERLGRLKILRNGVMLLRDQKVSSQGKSTSGSDNAMTGKVPGQIFQNANPDYGGVDFNPSRLDLEIHGESDSILIGGSSVYSASLSTLKIEGLVPVISNVTALPTLIPLLSESVNPK